MSKHSTVIKVETLKNTTNKFGIANMNPSFQATNNFSHNDINEKSHCDIAMLISKLWG